MQVRRALGNFGIAIAIFLMVMFAFLGRDMLYYDVSFNTVMNWTRHARRLAAL